MLCKCSSEIRNVPDYLRDACKWECGKCADRVQGRNSSTAMTLCLIKRTKKKGQD